MAERNIIDNFVSFFSPSAGLQRARSRMAEEHIRKYDAAARGRRTKDWDAKSTSANAETKPALEMLRNRSRDMVRNNVHAKMAIDVITTNTIGTGIRATVKASDKALKDKIMPEWNSWAESPASCDFDGKLDLYGLQELVMRSVAESGECIILRKPTKDKKRVPLQIQVLEADFLYPYNDTIDGVALVGVTPTAGNKIIQGVEFDPKGKRVAYWLYKEHPGDLTIKELLPERVPAKNVIHVFRTERPGQVRGVPFGASALLQLKDLQDFQDAELVKQKVASCFTAFITEPTGDPIPGKKGEKPLELIEPGIIEHLPPGKQVTFSNPPVNSGYSEYVKRLLQAIAVGFGITYEALTSDLSMVNFSSGRMGWLEFHRRIQSWQYNIMVPACENIWEWFMEAAELGGQVKQYAPSSWTPCRREMIDPVKEVKGLSMQVRSGFLSLQEAIRQQGDDPDTRFKEIKEDYASLDASGIKLDVDVRNDIVPPKDILK